MVDSWQVDEGRARTGAALCGIAPARLTAQGGKVAGKEGF